MSLAEAVLDVVPPPGSWKRTTVIASDLRMLHKDEAELKAIEPHQIHPVLTDLVIEGKVRKQEAVLALDDSEHCGYEYQRSY